MKEKVASLLNQQAQCVLATQGHQEVALHLMAYAFRENLNEIYLATYANTLKVKNIGDRPNVSCLWDNRTGNNADHAEGFAMTGFGQAREVTGPIVQSIICLLLDRNFSLKKLLSDPAVVIIAVSIDRYQWVEGCYSQSMVYEPAKQALNDYSQ
jgi:hypothetical protein